MNSLTMMKRPSAFLPVAMSLAYESAEGMPAFVSRAINRWSIYPEAPTRCLVRTDATFDLHRPMRVLAPSLRSSYGTMPLACSISCATESSMDGHTQASSPRKVASQ